MKRLAEDADSRGAHRGDNDLGGVRAVKRGVGRPSKAQPFRAFVVDLLLKHPQLRSLEIVRRAKAAGYDGGKSALYSLIASVRPRRSRPLSQQDKVPGEISRHGMGQVDVRFKGGEVRSVNFFATRLEYSRWIAVSIVEDQSIESLVRALVHHFDAIGGIPLLAAFDRPKPIGIRVRPRRPGHRVGFGVRVRGHPAGAGGRGAGTPRRRPRAGHQPGQLGQTLLLQIAHLRQRSRHGTAAD